MQELENLGRIDFLVDAPAADPRFSTDYLFGNARGQMFGVLECEDSNGQVVVLRAFSSQYNAAWQCEGWVPPLFDTMAYDRIMNPGDLKIKELGHRLDTLASGSEEHAQLRNERKQLSQAIMKEIQSLYVLRNFRGQARPLTEFFKQVNGPPTGAGDCCAPKLLNQAVQRNLKPLGITEFYWGKTNRSGERIQGRFYDSCAAKCQPILGFMLCGAQI